MFTHLHKVFAIFKQAHMNISRSTDTKERISNRVRVRLLIRLGIGKHCTSSLTRHFVATNSPESTDFSTSTILKPAFKDAVDQDLPASSGVNNVILWLPSSPADPHRPEMLCEPHDVPEGFDCRP